MLIFDVYYYYIHILFLIKNAVVLMNYNLQLNKNIIEFITILLYLQFNNYIYLWKITNFYEHYNFI